MLTRTVIKLSGEALAGDGPGLYDDAVIDAIVGQIIRVVEQGVEVALVVGGGNIWRGRSAGLEMDRVKADSMGMLATVMNALYLCEAFARHGAAAQVVTPIPVGAMTRLYERDAALSLMKNKTVLINAAGLGHPFFSTDTIAALRAAELNAQCILYAKSIDGVYELDPRLHPGAKKYRALDYATAIARDLNAADIAALHLAKEARIPSFMFELARPDSLLLACSYPETGPLEGTYIDIDTKEDFYVSPNEAL